MLETDKQRFLKVIELLPEPFMDELMWWFSQGRIENSLHVQLVSFQEYSRQKLAQFDDQAVNRKFNNLIKISTELFGFILQHFFRPLPTDNYLEIYPDHHHAPDRSLWDRRYKEFMSLVEQFEKRYGVFIKQGRELLRKESADHPTSSDVDRKHRFPHKLPRGTKWGNIAMQFLEEGSTTNERFSTRCFPYVVITVRGFKQETNYEEMGFADRRNGKPDKQWILLCLLAQLGGALKWIDPGSSPAQKKTVQALAKRLQEYFAIESDPFEPYGDAGPSKEGNSYQIKMILTVPEGMSIDVERGPRRRGPPTTELIDPEGDTDAGLDLGLFPEDSGHADKEDYESIEE